MNRQFTFGQELAEAQKAEIEVVALPAMDEIEEVSDDLSNPSPTHHKLDEE
jgi:hypothetical protein